MESLKLLLWSPNGSGSLYGGPGMSAFRLFNSNSNEQLKVSLVHGRKEQGEYAIYENSYFLGRVVSGYGAGPDLLCQSLFLHKAKKWIRDNADEFDVFYGLQGFHFTVVPGVLAEENNLPALVKIVQYNSDLKDKSGWKRIFNAPRKRRKLINRLSGIISISSLITKELLNYGYPEEKIAFIPNGVDTKIFHPVSGSEKASLKKALGWKDIPTIMFCGSVIKRKQPHLLIDAALQLKRQGTEIQLVFVGPEKDEEYSSAMRQRILEEGIEECVVWEDFSFNVAPFYKASDIFILLSVSEGMPNSLLEAMASGLPSLVTRVSGVDDIITDGINGFIISEGAIEVASVVEELLKNSYLMKSVSLMARDTILANFSSEIIFQKQLEVFRRAKMGCCIGNG